MTTAVIPASQRMTSQSRVTKWKNITHHGDKRKMRVFVRYDDSCKNGHNSFAITAEIATLSGRVEQCGCCHDEVVKHFPEFKRFLKWHLMSSDGPMHYFSNVVYFAGDRDYNGLLKGEQKVKKNKEGLPMFEEDGETPVYTGLVGEGKEREFDAARRAAVWPEATDEQLSLPKDELIKLLAERLPALLEEFKKDMEELGFTY